MTTKISFDNDYYTYDDGLRLMTEGEVRYNGRFVCRVGVYRRSEYDRAYVREATVLVPTGPTARSMTAEKLRTAVERRLDAIDA
ncbi:MULTISPECIES: hypothetical protein [Methylobacterium]|jgi:hypothetical protein|uniref:Uncharacterized protein n=2 Tax=Methylobacterium TaxID=407 RepID=A0A2R4WS00_9HYPH|nr:MULTISPECIES: hypothetical protein [Methylobacterium]AWB24319.1 hypothetical protein DA075_28455 [Methylobacterium currus]NGM33781.1 hypothetical protein [Methylobacterium sp. DB0501]